MEQIKLQDCYQWVLASERLPPMEVFSFVKDNTGGKLLGNFFQVEDNGEVCFSVCGTEMYKPFYINQSNFDKLYWLEKHSNMVVLTKEQARQMIEDALDKLAEYSDMHPEYFNRAITEYLTQLFK